LLRRERGSFPRRLKGTFIKGLLFKKGINKMSAKSNLKVQNIVATTSLGKPVSLTQLAKTQSNTEYNPEQFPGLVLRVKEPKSAEIGRAHV
jgi:TATA-box binding protein (TBP) (component of TFIID and TFIIIB)